MGPNSVMLVYVDPLGHAEQSDFSIAGRDRIRARVATR